MRAPLLALLLALAAVPAVAQSTPAPSSPPKPLPVPPLSEIPTTLPVFDSTAVAPVPRRLSDPPVLLNHPVFVRTLQTYYPPQLLEDGVEGRVRLRLVVSTEGLVEAVTVLHASHPDFGPAAESAARVMRFRPGRDTDGVPARAFVVVPISFQIGDLTSEAQPTKP